MPEALIGRQPIFDRDMNVFGYEMLYRSEKQSTHASFLDGNMATSQVMLNLFLEIGLEHIVGTAPAFINLTKEFITGEHTLPFGPEQVVLEVLEDITADTELENALIRLSNEGYSIALDDFVPGTGWDHMVQYVDFIKVEYPEIPRHELPILVERLKEFDVKLLAEKLETQEDHDHCMALGFDYFQGYFYCKPKVISSDRIPQNKLAVMTLLNKIQDPDISMNEVSELVKQNIALSYKILRYINSAAFSMRTKVESIDRAIGYIGLDQIKQWVTIMSLAGIDDKPLEIIETALIRSKMCEILARECAKSEIGKYSTVGLLSIIDVLMDKPMEKVLEQLPLASEINSALIEHYGDIGDILETVLLYEQGKVTELNSRDMDIEQLSSAYLKAVIWEQEIRQVFIKP